MARASGALRAPRSDMGTLRDRAASHYDLDPGLQKRVAAPCSNLGPTGGPTALPTGSASCFITHSRRIRVEGPTFQPVRSATGDRSGRPRATKSELVADPLNQTSNQTSAGSLVSWPCLPRFGHFPFHFPFRGEKGSAPCGHFLWGAPPPRWCRTFQKRVAAPCSYLGPAGGPTALPTGSATRIIT